MLMAYQEVKALALHRQAYRYDKAPPVARWDMQGKPMYPSLCGVGISKGVRVKRVVGIVPCTGNRKDTRK